MSLRKIAAFIAATTLSLGLLGANTTEATAATGCPDKVTVYAGAYVEIDLTCFDKRVEVMTEDNEDSVYHLFSLDYDRLPGLGGAFEAPYSDEEGLHSVIGYFANPLQPGGIDTIRYVIRKGTSGTEFEVGWVNVEIKRVPPVASEVTKLLKKKRPATDQWGTVPEDAPGKYKLLAGTYNEPQPRITRTIRPGQLTAWSTRLRDVDYELYLVVDGWWAPANFGHINNVTGVIEEMPLNLPNMRSAARSVKGAQTRQTIVSGWGSRH